MDPEKQRAIASKGGKAAHAQGLAHEFSSEEASEAGTRGAQAMLAKHGPEHMARIGALGGAARARRKAEGR
jgi:hypothetical protein